jgi:acetyltransferase-like isoleucine patch superfamily enzyme
MNTLAGAQVLEAVDFTALGGSDAQKFLRRMGADSWLDYAKFAIVTTLTQRRRGATGIALRRFLLPLILGQADHVVVLEDVVIRGASHIRLGKAVAVEHHVVLDAKSTHPIAIRIDADAVLRAGTFIDTSYGGYVQIGERTAVGPYCQFWGGGGIVIGKDVLFSKNVSIVSTDHGMLMADQSIKRQSSVGRLTTVEDGCFLGVNVVVLPGVTIGAGTVVGANSVVTRDLPPRVIAAGSPARILREREAL